MMNLASLTKAEKEELNTRLCAVNIVSWQWNDKGLALHEAEGRTEKLKNETEIGVIAQNVRDKLQDLFPSITPTHPTGALMVDYGLLANIATAVLPYLDETYQSRVKQLPADDDHLQLDKLLEKHQSDNSQVGATKLLALIKLYNQKLAAL